MPSLRKTKDSISNMSEKQLSAVFDLDKITRSAAAVLRVTELLRPQIEMMRAVQEMQNRAIKSIFEPMRIHQETMKRIGEQTVEAAEFLSELFTGTIKKVVESFQVFLEPMRKIIKTVLDFLNRLRKSNFILIIKASEGDNIALDRLGKLWWHLMLRHIDLERIKGGKPTKDEFHVLVQEVCWEILNKDGESTSWFDIPKRVYFSISARLLVNYAEIYENRVKNQRLNIDIIGDNYTSSLSFYRDSEGNPHLFVKTLAKEIGVSPQTVRNWIRKGEVKAINYPYFSRIRRAVVPSYLVPYQDGVLREIENIKKEQESKKLHRIEGYFTISQIIKAIPISRKTLERWDKAGKLVPRRIKGNRYYSLDKVKAILPQSQSPRVRSFVLQRNHANALAS